MKMDKYFIIWYNSYNEAEITECNSQGGCEKELDELIKQGTEVQRVIIGKEVTWRTHISTELKEI